MSEFEVGRNGGGVNNAAPQGGTRLSAALDYATRGWPVFPCRPQGKEPLSKNGFKDATTDLQQLAAWWGQWPNANVAIATGRVSGLVVLDVDPRHGGDVSLEQLEAKYEPLPETVESLTGGGGRHLLFAYPHSSTIRSRNSTLGPGLDIKAEGGYIVAPPSIHPSGTRYIWKDNSPDNFSLAPLPSWLLEQLTAVKNRQGSHGHAHFNEERATILADLKDALSFIPAVDHDMWVRVGMGLHFVDGNDGFAAWVDWSKTCPEKFVLDDCQKRWRSFDGEGGVTHRTIFDLATQHGWRSSVVKPGDLNTVHVSADTGPAPYAPPWPTLDSAALYGLAGEIVRTIDPYTEADPVAVLLNFLTAFGNCLNAGPHARVQHDHHPARLFIVQVGDTSKGRKGTGWSTPRYLFSLVEAAWRKDRVKSGLSSGEGLIYNVRNPVFKKEPIKEKGRVVDSQLVCVDDGESDKRLLIIEPEFASVLTVANREGNTLSEVVRQAWESGNLSPLTKNNPIAATGAHVSLIGHITKQELLARLDDTSKANGFANRFLWCLVKRSKELPEGGAVSDEELLPLADRLRAVISFARSVSLVRRDAAAKAMWAAIYHDLGEGKPGLIGAVLARAEAQVLRISLIFALLDMSAEIRAVHLEAALALWDYCERSAVLIFGDKLGDPTADRIREALNANKSMTENDIVELFSRNKKASELARAKNLLLSLGLISLTKEDTQGRPRTVYRATR